MKRERGSRSPSPARLGGDAASRQSSRQSSRAPSPSARLAEKSTRGRSPAPPRSFSPTSARGDPSPPRPRQPLPPDARPVRPAVKGGAGAEAVRKILGAGIAFSSTTKAAAAPLRRTWAAAAAALRSASAMFQGFAAQARPVVHLAAAPAVALIRTFVVVVVFSAQGPARFLVPRESDCLVGHVSSEPAARQAALTVARGVLSLLPIPKLHAAASPLLIPAFERIPASGDPVHTVDRVVAVPLFSGDPPPFSGSHDGWLHWITLAAASPLIYVMVAHAINRVRTYRATIPRSILDALMSASTRLRSGALELRRLGSSSRKRASSPRI